MRRRERALPSFMRYFFKRDSLVSALPLVVVAGAATLAGCTSDDAALPFDSTDDAGDAGNDVMDGPDESGDAVADGSDSTGSHEGESGVDVASDTAASDDAPDDVASSAEGADEREPTGDAASEARDALGDCTTPGIIHVPPVLPAAIAVPAGVTLFAGYHGSGNQVYVCEPAVVEAGVGASGTWVSAPVATLYGGNCAAVITHSFAAGSPAWSAIADGSSVVAQRDGVFLPPLASGQPPSLPWLRWTAILHGGAGIFSNVTYIQRVDTVGGVGPSGPCDPRSDASSVLLVPFSATYFFYVGAPAPPANDAGSPP